MRCCWSDAVGQIIMGNAYTYMGDNSVKMFFSPFLKGAYYTRNEFAPAPWSKFCPFRIDSFSEGTCCAGEVNRQSQLCLPMAKWRKIYHMHQVPSEAYNSKRITSLLKHDLATLGKDMAFTYTKYTE